MRRIERQRIVEYCIVGMIAAVALALRVYRIGEYAIFLPDQAIDSTAVHGVLQGHMTLLGPRASVGDFYNGPIVYYLMVPFFWLMGSDPLAGTVFQITLQIATIPVLYALTRRLAGVKTALISIIIFTFSPLYIEYSRGAFNAYPALFFSTVIAYLVTRDHLTPLVVLFIGILCGMMVQMHYLLYVYVGLYGVYLAYRTRSIRHCVSFIMGCMVGLSPFLVFELRHDFLNLRAIFMGTHSSMIQVPLIDRLGSLVSSIGMIFGISGIGSVFGVVIGTLLVGKLLRPVPTHVRMWYLTMTLALLLCLILYKGVLLSHYILGFHIVCLVYVSGVIARLPSVRIVTAVMTGYILYMMIARSDVYGVPKAQDGLSLQDVRRTAQYIGDIEGESRSSTPWNVTQDAQQDNRAMGVRYLLSLEARYEPLPFTDYLSNRELFVVHRTSKPISTIDTWEVRSFGSEYTLVQSVRINDTYSLAYLRKR